MSLKSVAQLNALPDPLKQYEVKFTISTMRGSSGLGGIIAGGSGNGTTTSASQFEMLCQTFSFPGSTIKCVETYIGTHYRRRPAIQDKSGTWKTFIYETKDGRVHRTIQNWLDLINNPLTGIISPSTLYTSLAKIEFGPDRTIYLRGVYPIAIGEITVSSSDSGAVVIPVQWNYDWYSESELLGL